MFGLKIKGVRRINSGFKWYSVCCAAAAYGTACSRCLWNSFFMWHWILSLVLRGASETVKTTKFFQILLRYFKNSKIRALDVIKKHVSRSPNPEDEYILKFNANLTIHFRLSTRPTSKNDAKKWSEILCLSFTWDEAKWKCNSNPVSSKIAMLPSYFPKDLEAVTFLFVDQSFRFEC